jgi:hypothetical protein
MKRLCVLASLVLAIGGCATSTKILSQKSQDGSSPFVNFLVWGSFSSLESKRLVETTIASDLNKKGCTARPAGDFFLWDVSYTPAEIDKVIKENGFDCLLFVSPAGLGLTDVYVPGSSKTHSEADYRITATGVKETRTSRTDNYGGYNVSKPWMNVNAKLFETKEGRPVWVAESKSHGRSRASFDDLKKSISHSIVDQLEKDGLLHIVPISPSRKK